MKEILIIEDDEAPGQQTDYVRAPFRFYFSAMEFYRDDVPFTLSLYFCADHKS